MALIDGMQATFDMSEGIDGFGIGVGDNDAALAVCNSDEYNNGVLIGLHPSGEPSVVLVVSTALARSIGQAFITYADRMDEQLVIEGRCPVCGDPIANDFVRTEEMRFAPMDRGGHQEVCGWGEKVPV